MNIFNFFNKIYEKLVAVNESKFQLDDKLIRIENSLGEALREALINTLVHADYFVPRGTVKISVHDDRYVFSNPGCMLISKDDFFVGGKSEIRNEILMKCFRLQGLAEEKEWVEVRL